MQQCWETLGEGQGETATICSHTSENDTQEMRKRMQSTRNTNLKVTQEVVTKQGKQT